MRSLARGSLLQWQKRAQQKLFASEGQVRDRSATHGDPGKALRAGLDSIRDSVVDCAGNHLPPASRDCSHANDGDVELLIGLHMSSRIGRKECSTRMQAAGALAP